MMVNFQMIRDRVKESSDGRMEEYTRDSGKMGNNMVLVYFQARIVILEEVSGKTVERFSGLNDFCLIFWIIS